MNLDNTENADVQQIDGTSRKKSSNANVEYGDPVVLHESSKTKVIALPWYIKHTDRTALSLKVQSFRKSNPPFDWIPVEEKSITLNDVATARLLAELPKFAAIANQETAGDYLIVKLADGSAEIGNLDPKAVVGGLLGALKQKGVTEYLNGTDLGPELAKALRYSVRLSEMHSAVIELQNLLDGGTNQERFYQEWCEAHPWAFGNQFVVNDEIRNISAQDQVDILLPRIMAGYRDIIELKRPDMDVLRYDPDHRNYYFSAEVSKAIGQCHRYLDVFSETAKNGLLDNPQIVSYHPEATIVIGRMSNWSEEEVKALHGLNSRLSGIRVITYDHLLAQGECLVNYLSAAPEEYDGKKCAEDGCQNTFGQDEGIGEMPF